MAKPLALVFPEDRAALMIDVFVVMQAFNEGQIGPKSANIFTRLLHECGVILKQGPLYDTDHENAVRRVVVTPEGEEIAPAREVPESGEDCASSDTRFAQDGEAVSEGASSDEAVSEEKGEEVPHTSNDTFYVPPVSAADFACNDPCYIENLTQRREKYRAHVECDLAAGRDPRAWDDFDPEKSRARRPKPVAKCW